MDVEIRPYQDSDEEEWKRAFAIIMTQSQAWNDSIQQRPDYGDRESDCLVALVDGKIAGITDNSGDFGDFGDLKSPESPKSPTRQSQRFWRFR